MNEEASDALVRRLTAELIAAEHRLLGPERARLVAGGWDSHGALAKLHAVVAGFGGTVALLMQEADGLARAEGLAEDYAAPGPPHIIRWHGADEATIEDQDRVIALLRMLPEGAFQLATVHEPPSVEGRDHLARSVTWALEEHKRRSAEEGAGRCAG